MEESFLSYFKINAQKHAKTSDAYAPAREVSVRETTNHYITKVLSFIELLETS